MTENQVGLLFSIASQLPSNNEALNKLRSHYLMRCYEVTRGFGLPARQFSNNVRCPHCCSEWTRESDVKLKPVKLSKSQRRRIKSKKQIDEKINLDNKTNGVHLNEIIQTCTLCHKSTTTLLKKPTRMYQKLKSTPQQSVSIVNLKTKIENKTFDMNKGKNNKDMPIPKLQNKNDSTVNLYTNAHDIFSLKNDKNTLLNTIKPASKVIKNNKKKKDKFAGLCHKAVLASAKLKQEKDHSKKKLVNKLSLFLKPSST